MNWINYAKSFFSNPEIRYSWVSVLIIFTDNGNLVLDKGYVFLGDLPIHYLGYCCNFTNFSIISGNLYYLYQNGVAKQIDPAKVYLHVKISQVPFEITRENLNYWNLFFSSINNKMYKAISPYLDDNHIKMIDFTGKFSHKKRLKSSNIFHPLFSEKQTYGINMDQTLFSKLNISLL